MKSWLYISLLGLVATLLVIAVGPDTGALAALPVTSAGPAAQQPLTAVSRLAAGYAHTCALLLNGTVNCWGNNVSGQLGDGTTLYRSLAVPVLGLSDATMVTAGADHTCAVIRNGTVQCWGDNWRGQLGNGINDASRRPVTVSGLAGNVTAAVAGGYHTCALAGGAVFCWGTNDYGQVGDGTQTHRNTPVPVSGLESGVIALAAGMEHTCALRTTGAVFCWGRNQSGQLGNGAAGDGAQQSTPVAVPFSGIITAITAGQAHSCARLQSGGIICWGDNGEGQLGDGSTTMRTTPVAVSNLTSGVTALVAGSFHTCALQTISGAATAFCWGGNWNGALGHGAMNSKTPVAVLGLRDGVAAVVAGGHHTCAMVDALAANNRVQCWGVNRRGQLGDGEALYLAQPTLVNNLPASVTAVAAGGEHVCAIGGTTLSCWGLNWVGQLGFALPDLSTVPIEVVDMSEPDVITTGSSHSCALTQQGALYCWGWNSYGQLGNGTAVWRNGVTPVTALATGVTAVDAGNAHTCALTQAGAAYCWGVNWNGRLGDGTTDTRLTPTVVQGLPSTLLTAIRTGRDHTCALSADGAVFCWGANWRGQLGHGAFDEQHKPVMVAGLSSDVKAIAVGAAHSCALVNKLDNATSVVCWGANQYGQLGDGTTLDRLQPVAVQGLPAIIQAITADGNHTCALTGTGRVVCWGANPYGQLGDGTTLDRRQPVAVAALASGMVAVDAGSNHTCAVTDQGAVFCWGLDWAGQIGAGIQRWRDTPRDVMAEGVPDTAPTHTPTYTPTATPTIPPGVPVTVTPTPTRLPGVGDAFENDDQCTTAATLATDGALQTHTFHQSADVDWARFDATVNTTYRIDVFIPDDSPADVDVELHQNCDALPAKVWNATFTRGVLLEFTAVNNGPIFLRLKGQTNVGGDHVRYQLSVRPLAAHPQIGAVIIVAGRLKTNDPLQRNIHNVANRVYKLFESQGYTKDDITYLATDSTLPGYDAAATKENLSNAITQWAVDQAAPNKPLTLYLIDHGLPGQFYLDGVKNVVITPTDLNQWLTQFEQALPAAKVNVIMEACYIGSFITQPKSVRIEPLNSISNPNRVIITSTDNKWSAYASPDGAHFSDHFLTALQMGYDLFTSFEGASRRVNRFFGYQRPWLDADGNAIPNQQADFDLAAQRSFAYVGTLDNHNWPPFIASAGGPTVITNGHGLLTTTVRDDKAVESVWAVVYAPSYKPPTNEAELIAETAPALLLTHQGADRYAVEYPAFTEAGTYRIVYFAKDAQESVALPVEVTVLVGGYRVLLPVVVR